MPTLVDFQGSMSVAEISEQLNLTSIKDHGWHIQVRKGNCCLEDLFWYWGGEGYL